MYYFKIFLELFYENTSKPPIIYMKKKNKIWLSKGTHVETIKTRFLWKSSSDRINRADQTFLCLVGFLCGDDSAVFLRAPWGRWNILTCLFSLSLRLLHHVCAHLNTCNDKYSWFSYRIVTLPRTVKHSGHPGKWSWVYSNAPSPPHHHANCTLLREP